MSKSKAKGTKWESDCVRLLQEYVDPNAERRALAGTADKGDILVPSMSGWVFECKAGRRIDLAGWLKETQQETLNAGASWGVLLVKAPRKPTSEGYAIMSIKDMARLLFVLKSL